MAVPFPVFDQVRLPSPLRHLRTLANGNELWLKDDSCIHPIYGGNKCRKLAHLLPEAKSRGHTRVTTFGAAGSHHVLATGLLARACGFSVRAFVIPQPWSAHAEQVLAASVACGVELIRVDSLTHAFAAALRLRDSGRLIPPGGTNACGSLGYYVAALELAAQVKRGEMSEPDWIVVAFGTGGTAAGLLAGITMAGLRTRILGVSVVRAAGRVWGAHRIARRILKSLGATCSANPSQLVVTDQWLGAGYARESTEGNAACILAGEFDLPLDPTYTAKAFAGAWALLEGRKLNDCVGNQPSMSPAPEKVLYWHTLSAPCPLETSVNGSSPIPQPLRNLLRPCP